MLWLDLGSLTVGPVNLDEVDVVSPQPLEAALHTVADLLGIDTRPLASTLGKPRDHIGPASNLCGDCARAIAGIFRLQSQAQRGFAKKFFMKPDESEPAERDANVGWWRS
jgi:hypothetical protein